MTPEEIRVHMRRVRLSDYGSLSMAEQKTGLANVVIGAWERGDRNPPLTQLHRWTEAFGQTLLVVGPDHEVLSADPTAEEFVEYAVRTSTTGVIGVPSRAVAEALAWQMPGSQVVYRVHRRSGWESGGGGQ